MALALTLQTPHAHLKGHHRAGRNVRMQARFIQAHPLVEELKKKQWGSFA